MGYRFCFVLVHGSCGEWFCSASDVDGKGVFVLESGDILILVVLGPSLREGKMDDC